MAWSFTIARILGSEIRIHVTFLLLLAWIWAANYASGGPASAWQSVLFVITIFACVALHELGHALAARRYGIVTPDITLLPIGGLARLSRMPEDPWQEIVIAIAGPLVNVVIAAALILGLGLTLDPAQFESLNGTWAGFWASVASVNIVLVLFNLIPAFPMDGGRVLRAALSMKMGRRRATDLAARIGQGTAFLFGFIGLMTANAILVFVAIFVYLAATAEAGHTGLVELAKRIKVREAMVTAFESLGTDASLKAAGDAVLRTTQHEFPVLDETGHLRGFLTREQLVKALAEHGPEGPVVSVMHTDLPTVRPEQNLNAALRLIQEGRSPIVAVTDREDRFIGYVSQENITELWMLDDALAHRRRV